jgi:hypothetical protein
MRRLVEEPGEAEEEAVDAGDIIVPVKGSRRGEAGDPPPNARSTLRLPLRASGDSMCMLELAVVRRNLVHMTCLTDPTSMSADSMCATIPLTG